MVKKPPANPGGFPMAQTVKNPPSLWETWARSSGEKTGQSRRHKTHSLDPWVRKIPWRRAWQSAPVFLPGESHGQRSLTTVHRMAQSQIRLKRLSTHTYTNNEQSKNKVKKTIPFTISSKTTEYLGIYVSKQIVRPV